MPTKQDTNYDIPKTVGSLDLFAFSNNIYLQSITIPSSITLIPHSAFRFCENLQTITYEGTKQPICEIYPLDNTHPSLVINVPSTYNGTTFCGKPVTKQST